jgi:TldD protein
MSELLREAKPRLKELISRLHEDFAYASVLGTDVVSKTYDVTSRVTTISDGMWGERGFVVRVYGDGRYFEYALNQLPENSAGIGALAEKIARSAKSDKGDAFNYPPPDETPVTQSFRDTVGQLPHTLGPDKIIGELTAISRRMRERSPLVVEAIANLTYAHVSKVFVSSKRDLEQSYIWSTSHMVAATRRGDVTRMLYKTFSGMKGIEILSEMEGCLERVVDDACKLLDAKPIPPGEYDIICSPDAVGIIAHEAFGHGVELDMFLKNRANAEQYMGKQVASPIVKMHDGAKSERHVSSYLFDDEGNHGADTVIIENGMLKAGISDALSAMRLGLKPTGNGRRQAYSHKAYSRMTNTFFAPGTDKLDDMIASVKHGYLIEDAESGMEDPKDWGIQVVFTYAREIVDGKVTDNLVAPVVMTGYVPDVLKAITKISDDFSLSGSGGCGKGYKETVKVSCGGPYIKTRARLG